MIEIKAHMRGRSFIPAHTRRPRAKTVSSGEKSRMLCVRLPLDTFERTRHLAVDRNGMTMSEFVRTLLERL